MTTDPTSDSSAANSPDQGASARRARIAPKNIIANRAATTALCIVLAGGLGYFFAQARQHLPAAASADILRPSTSIHQLAPAIPFPLATPTTKPAAAAAAPPATTQPVVAVTLPEALSRPAVPFELSPEQLFKSASPSVLTVRITSTDPNRSSLGTGFIVSNDGLVVTNYHVIRYGASGNLQTADGSRTYTIEGVVAVDRAGDLALLKTSATDLPALKIAPDAPPPVGARVYAIGNPEGFSNTLSEGLISGVRDQGLGLTSLQTTVAISHGSSGGPLLTPDGQVVGVTRSTRVDGQNLNFAVPANRIRMLINRRGALISLAQAGAPTALEIKLALDDIWINLLENHTPLAWLMLTEVPPQPQNSWYWFVSGSVNEHQGHSGAAIADYRRALALKPQYTAAIDFHLGLCLWSVHDFQGAIDACRDSVKANPGQRAAWTLASACFRGLGQYQRAVTVLRNALAVFPRDHALHFELGECYLAMKDYSSAEREYDQHLQLAPLDAWAWYQAGVAHLLNRDPSVAKTDWQQTIKLDPDGPYGSAARISLQRIASVPFAQIN